MKIQGKEVEVGMEVDCYYGNGSYIGREKITRFNDKSIWIGKFRESWNTVIAGFEKEFSVLIDPASIKV